jgi:hypothetical protein
MKNKIIDLAYLMSTLNNDALSKTTNVLLYLRITFVPNYNESIEIMWIVYVSFMLLV